MMSRPAGWLVLAIAAAACACRIPESSDAGAMRRDPLPDSTSVPSSWGKLVTVTVNPAFTDAFQLWFQDSTGTIHLVVYQGHMHKLSPFAPVITRR
jgi:hypothetical protein